MRKTYMTFTATATLALAIALGSCNNAEETKKKMEEQSASIQTMVDEKLNGLQEEVNAECNAVIDSLANVQYAAFLEESKKTGKKVVAKAKPKPAPKKEEPKTTTNPFDKATGQEGKKATNPFDKATGQEGKPAPKPTNPFDKATKP